MRDLNILLIRLRLIGDVVFTTSAIRAVRRRFPGARLVYLVEEPAAPVVAHNPHLDEVVTIARRRGLRRAWDDLRLAWRLRRARYDLVVDFHGGPRGSFLAWATGARTRIGYVVKGRSWMYTRTVDRPPALRARHSVENQFDLLAPLGIDAPDRVRDPTEMAVDPAVDESLAIRLREAGWQGHQLIIVHVSAGNPFRRWPVAAFVDLIVELADDRRRFIVSAGPSDRRAAGDVRAAVAERLGWNPILECGELSIAELQAAARRAALFIGGDSGPMHVAGTTDVPIVALYGPTLPARSAPWRDPGLPHRAVELAHLSCRPCDQRRCVPGDYRCLTQLTPSMVAAAAREVLGQQPLRQQPLPESGPS